MASPARNSGTQSFQYLRKTFDLSKNLVGTYEIGTIPANAVLSDNLSKYYMSVALSGTTNAFAIGFAADGVSSAAASAYHTGTLPTTTEGYANSFSLLGTAVATRPVTVDRTINLVWSGTATTGVFDVVIGYVPNN